MTRFATITPTRSDRPELLEFCKHQLDRFTLQPAKKYIIGHKPESDRIDILDRVKIGVEFARQDGIDLVFIIEDDDYYPVDYFQSFDFDSYTFFGSDQTIYYNLKNRTHTLFQHEKRSSLFTTGFKISSIDKFTWTAPRNRFLDVALWEYSYSVSGQSHQYTSTGAIGIKHNLGLCAGKGHIQRGKNIDENLQWLQQNVDGDAFEFYTRLMKKL